MSANKSSNIAAIPTWYSGILFRSRLEARWACFFDYLLWRWEYEWVDLKGWTPDFTLLGRPGAKEDPILVSVKPTYHWTRAAVRQIEDANPRQEVLLLGCSPMWDNPDWGAPVLGWLRHNMQFDGERMTLWTHEPFLQIAQATVTFCSWNHPEQPYTVPVKFFDPIWGEDDSCGDFAYRLSGDPRLGQKVRHSIGKNAVDLAFLRACWACAQNETQYKSDYKSALRHRDRILNGHLQLNMFDMFGDPKKESVGE